MKIKALWVRLGVGALVLGLLVVPGILFSTSGDVSAQGRIRRLPISAYLNLLPPTAFQGWTDPATGNFVLIDAYGKRSIVFGLNVGTTITGQVTIKDKGDGTQDVSVNMHTSNAICWGFNGTFEPAFGYRPFDVANGLGPASLGEQLLRIDYNQPAGPLALEGLVTTVFGAVRCDGLLRSGSGYPDGTPGFAQTTQTGLNATGVPGGCPPEKDADCFPAEKVQFKPRGN